MSNKDMGLLALLFIWSRISIIMRCLCSLHFPRKITFNRLTSVCSQIGTDAVEHGVAELLRMELRSGPTPFPPPPPPDMVARLLRWLGFSSSPITAGLSYLQK
ncbi:hypothetical protein F5Y17DRAFT_424383 [Xylariaceae sp. FL0594]|nr:hypothetical protein F5Y17DRAFT_424383 [Xylariaceae sp. FL0594]